MPLTKAPVAKQTQQKSSMQQSTVLAILHNPQAIETPGNGVQNPTLPTQSISRPLLSPSGSNPSSQVTPQTSFASMPYPDEVNSLEYIPAGLINRVACAQIEYEDVTDEIEFWKCSVLCTVLGANPPFEVIKAFIKRILAQFEIDQIWQVCRALFLVYFLQLQDKLTVERRGFYFFDNKPFLVKGWNADLDMKTETLKSLPL